MEDYDYFPTDGSEEKFKANTIFKTKVDQKYSLKVNQKQTPLRFMEKHDPWFEK